MSDINVAELARQSGKSEVEIARAITQVLLETGKECTLVMEARDEDFGRV